MASQLPKMWLLRPRRKRQDLCSNFMTAAAADSNILASGRWMTWGTKTKLPRVSQRWVYCARGRQHSILLKWNALWFVFIKGPRDRSMRRNVVAENTNESADSKDALKPKNKTPKTSSWDILSNFMLTLCPLKLLHVYFDTIERFYLKTNKPRFSYYPGQTSGHSEPQSTESDPCK